MSVLLCVTALLLSACGASAETTTVTMNYQFTVTSGGAFASVTYAFPSSNPPLYYVNGAQIILVYLGPGLQQDGSMYTLSSYDEPTEEPLEAGHSIGCRKTEPTTYKVSTVETQRMIQQQAIYDELWNGAGSTYNGHELFQWICEEGSTHE